MTKRDLAFVDALINEAGGKALRFPRFVSHIRVADGLKRRGYRLSQASIGTWIAEKLPSADNVTVPAEVRYLVVGLTDDGEEVKRITVVASRLDEAKNVFSGFCDWIDVFEYAPDGTLAGRRRDLGWSRS